LETVGDLIKVLQEYDEDTKLILAFDDEALCISDVKGTTAEVSYREQVIFGKRIVIECDTIQSRWPEERPYT
jgi:maltodextrin utilization protein YvdJ